MYVIDESRNASALTFGLKDRKSRTGDSTLAVQRSKITKLVRMVADLRLSGRCLLPLGVAARVLVSKHIQSSANCDGLMQL